MNAPNERVCDPERDPRQNVDVQAAIEEMERSGGHGVQGLAHCWRGFDPMNRSRLELAFPDYFASYHLRAIARRASYEEAK